MEPTKESGLGFFLKNEREKKGLSREHLSKVTRLRVQYLEALETEEWEKLPSLVFVKGFVKTYTKALGLDYREVMGQFESSIPAYDDLPKPLVPPKKTCAKKYVTLTVVIILIVFVIILFLMKNPLSFFKKADSASTKGRNSEAVVQVQPSPVDVDKGKSPGGGSTIDNQPLENKPATAVKQETAATVTNIQAPAPAAAIPAAGTVQPPLKKEASKTIPGTVAKINGKYSLTGYVTSETYIKIYVDNEPPRDYIFPQGSSYQWTGNNGFYIIVGNAGGIEFDLNGKRIKGLGGQGDVVRLRLPDNFNLNINE